MTHRAALLISIVLTLAVSVGVLVGRDRLFAPERAASPATTTSVAAQLPDDNEAGQLTTTSPRIVTVTLPSTAGGASAQARSERGDRSLDREGDDHSRVDDDGYEHDGEYDDN